MGVGVVCWEEARLPSPRRRRRTEFRAPAGAGQREAPLGWGKGHLGGGRCGRRRLPARGRANDDRCLLSPCRSRALTGLVRAGSVDRLTQLFLPGWSSSDTFLVCNERS